MKRTSVEHSHTVNGCIQRRLILVFLFPSVSILVPSKLRLTLDRQVRVLAVEYFLISNASVSPLAQFTPIPESEMTTMLPKDSPTGIVSRLSNRHCFPVLENQTLCT
jgi:hypothetical protein